METLARHLGLSRNAVSLALRNDPSIPESTRQRVLEAAKEFGYQRNPAHGELMSQMRRKGHGSTLATLALINCHQEADAFRSHPTIPSYVAGCQARARELGYPLDRFWMHEPGWRAERWCEMLETRGIRGLVLIGMMEQNRIPADFLPVIDRFPAVVTGVRTRDPALSFACVDHHILTLQAFEQALKLGYKRPALVMDPVIDALVEHRFSAGYRTAQHELPLRRRIPPFEKVAEARQDLSTFKNWLDRWKPDVLFSLYSEVREWVEALGFQVPESMGLIQLEWRKRQPEWAGMNQHNDLTGQAAVDMLIGMIHRGEGSIKPFPRATLIGPSWVAGPSVRPQV